MGETCCSRPFYVNNTGVSAGRMWVLDVGPMGGPAVLVTPTGPNPLPTADRRG